MRFPEFVCLVSALALPLLLLGCEKPSVWSVSEDSVGVYRTTERCVSSPNFPKIYGPNEWCFIQVNESGILHIESFDTSSERDYLFVGERTLTGDIGSVMISVNPDIWIQWTSYSWVDSKGKGWRMCLEPPTPAPPSVWTSTAELGGVCRKTERCVSSPNFPQDYGPNELCALHVNESGILHIELFHVTFESDYLIVGDRKLTGDNGSMMISVNPDTTIEWTSNSWGDSKGKGWRMCLEPPTPPPPGFWTSTAEMGGVCRTTERCVSSPNFPQHYGNNELCVLHVNESGILHIESFDAYDYLIVGDFKFIGDIGNGTLLVSPDTTIEWTSDSRLVSKGWRACLEPPTPAPPSVWTSTAEMGGVCRKTERCVSSPNFPQKYGDNELCVLHVNESGTLHIESFDTEMGADYLTIGGCKISGSGTASTMWDVDPDTTIEWSSVVGGDKGKGWRACLEPHTPAPPSVMRVFVA